MNSLPTMGRVGETEKLRIVKTGRPGAGGAVGWGCGVGCGTAVGAKMVIVALATSSVSVEK